MRPSNPALARSQRRYHDGDQRQWGARWPSALLAVALCVVGAGCASRPVQSPHAEADSPDKNCPNDSNPLHLVSASREQKPGIDPDIESLLTQQPSDFRLTQINRRMYQSLHALDVELRRERRLAACRQSLLAPQALQAQSNDQSGSGITYSGGVGAESAANAGSSSLGSDSGGGSNGIAGGAIVVGAASAPAAASHTAPTASAPVQTSLAGNAPATGNFVQPGSLRKSALAVRSSGGNGATAPDIRRGSDNDVVARRLRKAAEQETDPVLRAKLWKEYTDYKQGTSAK
jgi:hypothetical protein